MKKVAVFGSGNGSNFQAIVEYFREKPVIFTAISDKESSYFLKRAKNLDIKNFYLPFEKTAEFLNNNDFDLIVLAGYMRILPKSAITSKMINIHPSLLPELKGLNAIRRAYQGNYKITGISVHYVNDEVDSGEIIAQIPVKIEENEKLEELECRIHKLEHILYPHVIDHLLFNTGLDIGSLFIEGEEN